MKFRFSGNRLTGRERKLQRFFEIIPGAASWTVIIGMIVLAFKNPLAAAVIIIAFDFYWFLRLLSMTLFLILSYLRLSVEDGTDWIERVHGLDRLDLYMEELKKRPLAGSIRDKVSLLFHRKNVESIKAHARPLPLSKNIYHLVIVPIVKETRDVVEPGIKSFTEGTFDPKQILVVLALEERASEEVKAGAEKLRHDYGSKFFDMMISVHPDGISGEARAKGANVTFAAQKAEDYLRKKGIPYENVVVSCFDADTVVTSHYFAALTYYFLACPDRGHASFQPVPVYNNNIWEAPGITRVLETGSSFFQLIEASNPEKLVTFSSHSMSFKALVEVGYWPVDMISDDSAIFWKAFIHFDGKYRVVPMNIMLSMDAVVAENWWKTVINVYKQKRRWAWGVENFPIVMRAFMRDRKISLLNRARYALKLFEGHLSWTTWAFLLTVGGWLPAIFASREFTQSVFYYTGPRIMGTIFQLASFSLITSIVLSLCLLPKRKEKFGIFKRIGFALQWLLVPFTIVFLSALPALDAQTRLMFGKYMTFWVTDKKHK